MIPRLFDAPAGLAFKAAIPESSEARAGAQQGWSEMLDRLANELAAA